MAINDKLNRIKEIKEDIKQALIDKGVEVTDEDSFSSYADKITNIPMEGGDPYYEELYNARTSNGTNMAGLFAYAKGDSLDLTKLDVSQCTDMSYMFDYCAVKDIDCSGWNLEKVNNVEHMFYYCTSNVDITGWNTDNLTSANFMFANAYISKINGISSLKLPGLTSLENMFNSAEGDTLDLSSWNIDNITNLRNTFYNSNIRRIDLSNWNTGNVKNMNNLFYFGYSSITEELIIPDWDMTNTASDGGFFASSSKYTKSLRYIDLSRSNDLTISRIATFLPTKTETTYGDICIPADSSQEVIDAVIAKYWRPIGPSFNVESFQITSELEEVKPGQKTKIFCHSQVPWYSKLNNIEFISSDDSIATVNENGEITAVSLGNVEIYARLKDTPEVISNTITFSVSETDSYPNIIKFRGTSNPTYSNMININGKNISLTEINYDPITGIYTYDAGESITQVKFNAQETSSYGDTLTELVKLDISNITDMTDMFGYTNIKSVDIASTWDTSNVTIMERLFHNCELLTAIDISNWNMDNVENPTMMFFCCSSLNSINVPRWNIKNSSSYNIGSMFYGCSSLNSIDLSSWNTDNVVIIGSLFENCSSLESIDLSSWNTANVNTIFVDNTFKNVPSTCQIYVGPNWTIAESDCSFTGTFIRVNPEYYTEYSIDSSTATFNMRSIDSINSGAYLPELSNGYDAVLLTLNDGSITTDLNTEANQVSSIKIYYPEETSYVKFANTKVKEVNHLSGSNITDCTGMFTNCVYLEKADLTSLDSTKVTVDTTMFEGVSPEAEIIFNESWSYTDEQMGKEEPVQYITGFTVNPSEVIITEANTTYKVEIHPNETGRPMSFGVLYNNVDIIAQYYGAETPYFELSVLDISNQSGSIDIIEYNSGCFVNVTVTVQEQPEEDVTDTHTLTAHYYTSGEYDNGEWVSINKVEDYSSGTGSDFGQEDDYGRYTTIEAESGVAYNVTFSYQGTTFAEGEFTFTKDTELWVIYGDSTIYTEKPGTEEPTPEEPDEDGLVEMVFHINDFKNAFNSLAVIENYDPYVYAEYDLENAPTDDYGKFITIKVTPNANNDINLSSNCGYDSIGFGIDTTIYSEIWFDTMNINLHTAPTRPNTITSLEGTYKLKINYYPHDLDISNGDYIRLDEGNYKRWINYKSSENNWYVYEEDVIANHAINFDAYGFYGEIPALTEDTEVWLMSHNFDIYTTKPEVPNFTSFNTRVHLQKQGSDYSEGWHLCVYTGNNSNTYDIPQENVDEFGLYFDIPDLLYTNIRHGFQFYSDAGDWLSTFDSKFTETHSELWMIDGDSTVYYTKPE